MGPPHSKTLAHLRERHRIRKVLDCGSPMPLFLTRIRCDEREARLCVQHYGNVVPTTTFVPASKSDTLLTDKISGGFDSSVRMLTRP
jgi:hypothetical protein